MHRLLLIMGLWLAAATLAAQDSVLTVRVAEGVEVELVYVPGGTFTMGSNQARGVKYNYQSARPEHPVTVGPYYIARCEVTQQLYQAVMGSNPSKFNATPTHPVESVTWDEARQFALLLSQMTGRRFRLPSEAALKFIDLGDSIYSIAAGDATAKRKTVEVDEQSQEPTITSRRSYSSRRSSSRRSRSRRSRSRFSRSVTIQSGQTLSEIAEKHHTTVAKLKKLNKISGSSIRAGKKLRVK